MAKPKLKILIVEDHVPILLGFIAILEDKYLVLQASTCEDAEKVIKENTDIRVIAMDGILEYKGKKHPTFDLIKKIRKEYPAIEIIAMSANMETRKTQIESGCQYAIFTDDKTKAVGMIREILPT